MAKSDKSISQTPELLLIAEGNVKDLDTCLEQVIESAGARCALLIDKTGAIISRSGDFDTASPEVTAAVTAGAFAALQSLTKATEADELSIKFYGKKARKLYIARVSPRIYLTVLYDENSYATKIRAAARPAILKIAEILSIQQDSDTGVRSFSFIQDKISEVFKTRE